MFTPQRKNKSVNWKFPHGPTTRSRTNVVNRPEAPVASHAPVELPPRAGIGSMAEYLAMRECQKNKDAQKKPLPSESANGENSAHGETEMPDAGEAVGEAVGEG